MLKKLQEAEEQLHRYEASAAPPGWSCHWDRYATFQFYTNEDIFFHNDLQDSKESKIGQCKRLKSKSKVGQNFRRQNVQKNFIIVYRVNLAKSQFIESLRVKNRGRLCIVCHECACEM